MSESNFIAKFTKGISLIKVKIESMYEGIAMNKKSNITGVKVSITINESNRKDINDNKNLRNFFSIINPPLSTDLLSKFSGKSVERAY